MSVTETFPAWYLGRNPDRRVIETSYSDDLSRTFGDSAAERSSCSARSSGGWKSTGAGRTKATGAPEP